MRVVNESSVRSAVIFGVSALSIGLAAAGPAAPVPTALLSRDSFQIMYLFIFCRTVKEEDYMKIWKQKQ